MKHNIYVLYGSQTGNAEEIAQNINNLFFENNIEVQFSSLNKTIKGDEFTFLKDETNIDADTDANTHTNADIYKYMIK